MIRATFMKAVGAAALPVAAIGVPEDIVPSVLDGGRFFATPRTAVGLPTKWWLDTDGGGFVFSDSARRLHLAGDGPGRVRLPRFASASMPAADDLRLPVLDSKQAADDPLLRGFDGQLGASWFVKRRWVFDYPAATLHCNAAPRSSSWLPVELAGGNFPRVRVELAGTALPASFDTAASVALQNDAVRRLGDGLPAVRATSFVKRSLFEQWQTANPGWPVLRSVGIVASIDAIRVPSVSLGQWALGPQWFTTRPGDDVFEGETIALKLGASAFSRCSVELDYPRQRIGVTVGGRT
jgi:hypothetical protein